MHGQLPKIVSTSKEVLDDWKAHRIMWNGEEISEYDYIGRHMGYRFTVTQVKISRVSQEKKKQTQSQISKSVITLTIKNTASPICTKKQSAD